MKYLFDTDTCISLIDSREPGKQANIILKLEKQLRSDVVLSAITVSELMFGVENSKYRKTNLAALDTFLLDFEIMPFDDAAARTAGSIRAALERKGQRIGAMDTLIAAHAVSLRLTVVTNNVRDFGRVRGLKLENWSI